MAGEDTLATIKEKPVKSATLLSLLVGIVIGVKTNPSEDSFRYV